MGYDKYKTSLYERVRKMLIDQETKNADRDLREIDEALAGMDD